MTSIACWERIYPRKRTKTNMQRLIPIHSSMSLRPQVPVNAPPSQPMFVAGTPIALVSVPNPGVPMYQMQSTAAFPPVNPKQMLGRAYGEAFVRKYQVLWLSHPSRLEPTPTTCSLSSLPLLQVSIPLTWLGPGTLTRQANEGRMGSNRQVRKRTYASRSSNSSSPSESISQDLTLNLTSLVNTATVVSEPSNSSDQGADESDESPGDLSAGQETNSDERSATSDESNPAILSKTR